MSVFKEVLEVERKYNHTISNANKKAQGRLNKLNEELRLKDGAYKSDYQLTLNEELKKKVKSLTQEGEKLLDNSKVKANLILENSNIDEAVKVLVEEFKNGF